MIREKVPGVTYTYTYRYMISANVPSVVNIKIHTKAPQNLLISECRAMCPVYQSIL